MAITDPRLFVDERGVWSERTPGHPSGIEWQDVYIVSGHKLNGITDVYTCVVLDWDYGEYMELYRDWPGFDQVIAAITERLPGIESDWFKKIEQLRVGEPPLEVWRRQNDS